MKPQKLIMSTFIQMPQTLTDLKTKSNFLEIYTYFLVRSLITNNSYTASITATELAAKIGVSDLTIKRYIKDLKPYFDNITKSKTTGDHYYNVYHFTYLSKDYSIVLPSLIEDSELTAEQKGILLKIKMECEKGTNFIKYISKSELVKILGIGKNQINRKLQPLLDKGYISYVGNSLQLSQKYFPLSLEAIEITNYVYKVIYDFCLHQKVCPPLREAKALNYIAGKYPELDDELVKTLQERCAKLPREVSLDYFVYVLSHKEVHRDNVTDYGFIID